MTSIALRYGYGIQINKCNINIFSQFNSKQFEEWLDEAITALGGPEITMPFQVLASPWHGQAHEIFTRELQNPLDWEKIKFPNFLLEIWQQPLVVAALFLRWGPQAQPSVSVKELPPPTSIYRVMNEIVALRASMTAPDALFHLDKQSMVPYKRT